MDSAAGTPSLGWVAPFGDPRIEACSRLPGAFRSVPRPSSPLDAKASTRCPSLARPAPAAAPPGRRVAYPCRRHRPRPRRDRHPPVSPASAGPEGIPEGRLARRHHTMRKGPGAPPTRRRAGPPARRGGGPGTGDRRPPPWGWWCHPCGMVGPGRLERPTSRLSGVRSDRLSYGPAPGAPGRGVAAVSGKGRADGAGRPIDAPRGQAPARGP